jgi:hypothetical protein
MASAKQILAVSTSTTTIIIVNIFLTMTATTEYMEFCGEAGGQMPCAWN